MKSHPTRRSPRDGFALVVVLLVLLALLVLCAPFLAGARNADRASTQLAERAEARIGLDAAARHARQHLVDTYPSADLDRTPYWDDLAELTVENEFPRGFLDANDARGAMWDVELADVSGKIDLNSAGPQTFANLMRVSMRFAQVVAPEAKELPLTSSRGLREGALLWSEGELVHARKHEEATITEFVRGVLGPPPKEEWRGGPRPASSHGAGVPVLDQMAFAPVLWRLATAGPEQRSFEAFEELPRAGEHALELQAAGGSGSLELPPEFVKPLLAHGTVHAGPRGGPTWQRAARLTEPVQGKKDGILTVDDARWFGVGTTVRIRDGQTSELALVQNLLGGKRVALDRLLSNDYTANGAVVDVLARRPVNLNTAHRDVLVALFSNLQVNGRNSRITADEAGDLADLVIESRPFTGFEDFLRRIVLPAAGIEKLPADAPVRPARFAKDEGFIDPWDAVALYVNGQNSNDSSLAFATMPYAFTSRDTYALELRSSVNAESGVERFSIRRDEVSLIAPQTELVRLWARQEDFDEELRLTRDAPWWATGPNATTRYDGATQPPSRVTAHLGTFDGQAYLPGVTDSALFADRESPPIPEHVFASRESQGFAQLTTTREPDQSDRRKGRVLHFDHETRDLEGRYLPDQIVARATDDELLQWTPKPSTTITNPDLFLRPLAFSMWLRPRTVGDAKFLDVGGVDSEVDRVSLLIEGSDLVLRVVDGFGDHRDTTEKEIAELRYALAGADVPGLPADTWSHVEIDVRGNRPSQMHMLVNGLAHGVRTPGLTRLTGALSQSQTTIAVESTEGFPATAVVRIGNELVEVRTSGNGTLDATRQETGKMAGFGGRLARERMNTLSETAPMAPLALNSIETSHPSGTPVELYGYAAATVSSVPSGSSQLASELGPFRTAIARGVEVSQGPPLGDPITIGTFGFTIGEGMKGIGGHVTGLVLAAADDGLDPENATPAADYMSAFHREGGYAAILQVGPENGDTGEPLRDNDGAVIGGIEIVRYTGWTDRTLHLDPNGRGLGASTLPNLANLPPALANVLGGRRSFVVRWRDIPGFAPPPETVLEWHVFVVPISLAVPGAGQVSGFLAAGVGNSQFAQLTHVDDAENTEWVRYDFFDAQRGQVVRDEPAALEALRQLLIGGDPPGLPPNPNTPGGGGGGGGPGGPFAPESKTAVALAPPAAPPLVQTTTSAWDPRLGKNENTTERWPISRAVETVFQFRGVLGTYSHKHAAATPILPVFRARAAGFDAGRPGRLDAVFVSSADGTSLGWPLRVHRAYVPSDRYEVVGWEAPTPPATRPTSTAPTEALNELYLTGHCWVALQARCPEPIAPGPLNQTAGQAVVDSRRLARLSCFPSGERPRLVTRAAIGGGVNGAPGAIPAAVVDEIVFGDPEFGRGTPLVSDEEVVGATLFLTQNLAEDGNSLEVAPQAIRVALSNLGADHRYLGDLPADGGLLRIGDEILAYAALLPETGDVTIAPSGRGLLGTRPQPHQTGEPVTFLEERVVSVLAQPAGASAARLELASVQDFPPSGTVLIGSELLTYTRIRGNALEMPRASSVAGAMDQKADALFRGRYGTTPADHAAGEAVILFPTRYPDLWAERADAPELAYFGLALPQPSAWFGGLFFSKEDTRAARIGVLQKLSEDVPWDADPLTDKRVKVFWKGDENGLPAGIDAQSDLARWRVFVDYQPGAFDLQKGLAHGWKETPRLKLLSVTYHAPSLVLSSVER